jgi:hypothetical protein
MKQTKVVMTYNEFAKSVGVSDRMTLEFSLGWHLEYVKANTVTQTARRQEWLTNYLIGKLVVTQQVADSILSTPRTKRSKAHQQAVMRASTSFGVHIKRSYKRPTSTQQVSKQVDPIEQALKLVEALTKPQQDKFFKRVSRK